jgi:hypothetical protein
LNTQIKNNTSICCQCFTPLRANRGVCWHGCDYVTANCNFGQKRGAILAIKKTICTKYSKALAANNCIYTKHILPCNIKKKIQHIVP